MALASVLGASACSSEQLRDQNYGTDAAQGYRFPDGGYQYQLDMASPSPGTDDGGGADAGAEADGGVDAGADSGTGDATEAGG
jgi:hypothetical protein